MTPTTDQRAVPGTSAGDDPIKTGMRCDLCRHWQYHYPDDMGVCSHEDGPLHPNGFVVPIAMAVLRSHLRTAYRGCKATTCTTGCERWASDGTVKAEAVEASRSSSDHRSDGAGDDSTGAQVE